MYLIGNFSTLHPLTNGVTLKKVYLSKLTALGEGFKKGNLKVYI